MILERGDMWSVFGKTDLFLITTNPIVRKDGAVVMGRGIAKEAATRFPDIPFEIGRQIESFRAHSNLYPEKTFPNYGVCGFYGEERQRIGFFMVKEHWRDMAKLDVIQRSTSLVRKFTQDFGRVDLNFPGIGNGRLRREDVLPIIEQLPDNVHVWEY